MEKLDFQVDTIHGGFSFRVASLIINENIIHIISKE